MFSSKAYSRVQQLSSHLRRYATESAPKASSGNNGLLYAGAGAGALAGGYYYYNAEGLPKEAEDAANKAKEAVKPALPAGDAKKVFSGGSQGFVSLVLDEVEKINDNTSKFRFKFEEPDQVSGMPVASALLTKFKGPGMEKPVIRPYTPTSDEDEPGFLDLVVKKYPDGLMSEHIHNLKPGQQLEIKGPIVKYQWEANKHDHIALIAGGTGITPMYQLARGIFKNPEDKTKVTLVFGNISEKDILLKKEFEALEQKFPNRFRAFYTLDNPPEKWQQGSGHINKDLLKTVIPGPTEKNVKVFICGPPGLYKAVSGAKISPSDQGEVDGILKELGYTKEQVFKF